MTSFEAAEQAASHVPTPWLDRYVAGEKASTDLWWALEAHLEGCASCRARLAATVARNSPTTTALLDRVRDAVETQLPGVRTAPRRARPLRTARLLRVLHRTLAPQLVSRLTVTLVVVAAALALDLVDTATAGRYPSLVLLVAPIAPLTAVAAAWSRVDPAFELTVASPRAGLELVLRRALAALVVALPALALAGWIVGASPARWLLPCLAFVAATLALGTLVGVRRAAGGLTLAWAVVVVGPGLLAGQVPAALDVAAGPAWAVVTVVVATYLVVNRREFSNLVGWR